MIAPKRCHPFFITSDGIVSVRDEQLRNSGRIFLGEGVVEGRD
jgi:hypothetical protein